MTIKPEATKRNMGKGEETGKTPTPRALIPEAKEATG